MNTNTKYRFSGMLQNSLKSGGKNSVLPARYFRVVTRNGESLIGLSRADLERVARVASSRLEAGELRQSLDHAGSLSGWALWKD